MTDAKVSFEKMDYSPCPPGDRPDRFSFECPNGKGRCAGLLLREALECQGIEVGDGKRPASWRWDGDRDRPTLSPSINCIGCWHGYIRAGKIVNA